jgi:4-hydroxyphenylpyruvate dioxygenase-like putative hemolysin
MKNLSPTNNRVSYWVDVLKGGKADAKRPSDFKPKELQQGIKEEKEHTTNKHIQTEIAMDHLQENPNYYSEMKALEKSKR